MSAAFSGHLEIVKLLFKSNAHVNDRDHTGYSDLLCVVKATRMDTAKYLIEAGTDLNIKSVRAVHSPAFYNGK